jgi:hypothetical protein
VPGAVSVVEVETLFRVLFAEPKGLGLGDFNGG